MDKYLINTSDRSSEAELVDYFSDDSSFYGDDDVKSEFELRVKDFDPLNYWNHRDRSVQQLAVNARGVDDVIASAATEFNSKSAKSNTKLDKSLPTPPTSVRSFSKTTKASPVPSSAPSPLSSKALPETVPFNPLEGNSSAKQLSEPILDFLTRLPPSTTTLSKAGPWIWICNPQSPSRPLRSDSATLKSSGEDLLANFSTQRHDLEAATPNSNPASITRKLTPRRKLLEADLISLAQRTGVLTGKWMLFPSPQSVDSTWRKIATATSEGTLGCQAKVATANDDSTDSESRLICVYTHNFLDKADIRKVLMRLRELGVVRDGKGDWEGGGKQIYYKCDAWTHLGLMSGNEWRIKASMYGSLDADMV